MGRPWLVLLLALALLEAALAGHILQELLDRERGAAQDGDQAEDSLRERLGKEKAAAEEVGQAACRVRASCLPCGLPRQRVGGGDQGAARIAACMGSSRRVHVAPSLLQDGPPCLPLHRASLSSRGR